MDTIIIKPKKPNKYIINKVDCIGCVYNPPKAKNCKSCGNWNNKL